MNWDQIESKWAAMTRRVQAEWPCKSEDRLTVPEPAVPPKARTAEPRPVSRSALSGAPTPE